jgi:putative membrane protein
MKAKNVLAVIVLGFTVLQACQNAGKNTKEIQSAAIDSAMEEHVITDTMALNRGANISVFVNEAALGGMMEIELGKIAQEKSDNKKIKDFAKKMVKDHTKIAGRLKALAEGKKIPVPNMLPDADLAHIAEMKNMSASDFDKHYMGMMVKDHIKTLDLFKSATTSGDSPLQNFAIGTLRTLEAHYKMAIAINDHLK